MPEGALPLCARPTRVVGRVKRQSATSAAVVKHVAATRRARLLALARGRGLDMT
jgi:hypothetical protein